MIRLINACVRGVNYANVIKISQINKRNENIRISQEGQD